jgi:hypothetical protein
MSVMAIKLFAHILRSTTPGEDPEEPDAASAPEPRRWVFRDLVVRRDDLAAWGLWRPAPANDADAARHDPAAEPLWADTQPWCHK